MFKYYVSMIGGIPSAFRNAWEAGAFWVFIVSSALAFISPTLWGQLPANFQLSRENAGRVVAGVLLYGIARANHKQVAALKAAVLQREISDRETYEKLVKLAEIADRLLIEREQARFDLKAAGEWRHQYYDLKEQIDDVKPRLWHSDRLGLESAWQKLSGNVALHDEMEENLRRASPILRALVASYEKPAAQRPS